MTEINPQNEKARTLVEEFTQSWILKYGSQDITQRNIKTFNIIGRVLSETVLEVLKEEGEITHRNNILLDEFNFFNDLYNVKSYNIIARFYMDMQPNYYLKLASVSLLDYYKLFVHNLPKLKELEFTEHQIDLAQEQIFALIENVFDILVTRIEQKYYSIRNNSIETLLSIMKYQDKYTKEHTIRVGYYSDLLAKKIFNTETSMDFKIGSQLHDIGKIGVPQSILQSPHRLTKDEFSILQRHPEIGAEILVNLEVSEVMLEVTKYHHERWDGKGYPSQLKKEEIPITARIVGLIDAFDAMTTSRPYSRAKTIEEAMEEIKNNVEKQFDPEISQVFLGLPFELINIKQFT